MIDYKRLFGGLIVLLLVQWGAEAIIYPYVRTISQAILATALVDYLCSLSLNIFYKKIKERKSYPPAKDG